MLRILESLSSRHQTFGQFFILSRHFYLRLFQNDFVSFENEMREKLIASLAVLSTLCGFYANALMLKYLINPDTSASWIERTLFFYLMTVIMGFAAIMEWDILFPDRTDLANLAPLPIKAGTIFSAKFFSLLAFGAILALGLNLLSSLVFAYYFAQWQAAGFFQFLQLVFVHLFVGLAACLTIFFLAAFGIGLLMTLCGPRLFNRVSIYLRALFLILFILQMIFFAAAPGPFVKTFGDLDLNSSGAPMLLKLFPPLWFTGLYETLTGNSIPVFADLARIAMFFMIASPLGFALVTVAGYRRSLLSVSKSTAGQNCRPSKRFPFSEKFKSLIMRNPVERAVYDFIRSGIKRSLPHRMQMLSYMAVSIGLSGISLAYHSSKGLPFSQITKNLLVIPLLLLLLHLVGIRQIFNIPFSLKSNWVFRITENPDKNTYTKGIKMGAAGIVTIPVLLLFLLPALYFWGLGPALLHTIFCSLTALLLTEILFGNYFKIPFTCSYLPGKAKLPFLFSLYFIGILFYGKALSAAARALISNPALALFMAPAAAVITAFIRYFQHRRRTAQDSLKFEEIPDPVVLSIKSGA